MGRRAGLRGARLLGAFALVAAAGAGAQSNFGTNVSLQSSTGSSEVSTGSSRVTNQSSGTSRSSSQSDQSTQSSAESSRAGFSTGVDQVASSWIVAGSAGLLTTAGGIVLTIYAANADKQARLRREMLRKSAPPPVQPPPPPRDAPPLIDAPPPVPTELGPPPATPTPPPMPPPFTQRSPPPDDGAPLALEAMLQARAWLLANQLQLRQDLALGAGPALDDLAGIAGIAPARRAHFGRSLRGLRHRLLVAPDVTALEASRVMSEVGELVLTDPVLRPDALALLASW